MATRYSAQRGFRALTAGFVALGLLVGGYAFGEQEAQPAPTFSLNDQIDREAQTLDGPEKIEVAQEKIGEMKDALGQTNDLLNKAREEEGDILKLNCINEKLAAIRGFLKVSEQSYVNLKESVSRTDDEAAKHHFTLIGMARLRVGDLYEEAQTCVGEVQQFAGEPVIDRRVDPDIADIQFIYPDDDEFDDGYASERLPELTPFQ